MIKSQAMYELMLVTKTSGSADFIAEVEKALKNANATDLKVDNLGKKLLAYPIKKQTEADFTVFLFNVEGSAIANLTSVLRLEQENLLRYLLTVQKIRKPSKKKFAAKKEDVIVKEEKVRPKVTVVTKKVTKESKTTIDKRPTTKVEKVKRIKKVVNKRK